MSASSAGERLCLVDGSGVFFRAYHALPPLATRSGLPTGAIYGFTTMLAKLLREKPARYLAVVVDAPGPTFRDEAFAEYKATRSETPSDLSVQIPYIKRMVEALGLPLLEVSGVEADDVIGTLAQQATSAGLEVDIVTSDKDMMQLVGPSVRIVDTVNDRVIREPEVRARFGVGPDRVVEVMALMGDSIDNIPGVRGIGEKTATRLIEHFGSIDEMYRRLDEIEGLGLRGAKRIRTVLEENEEVARQSRFLATIRRDVGVDLDLAALERRSIHRDDLTRLAATLEFSALLRDLLSGASVDPESAGALARPEVVSVEPAELAAALDAAPRAALAIAGGPGSIEAIALCRARGEPVLLARGPVADLARALAPSLAGELGGVAGAEPGKEKTVYVEDVKAVRRAAGLESLPAPTVPATRLADLSLVSYVLDPGRRGHTADALAMERLRRALPRLEDVGADERAVAVAAAIAEMGPGLVEELETSGLEPLYRDLELPVAAVLAAMEARGIAVDRDALLAIGRDFDAQCSALEREIHALAGEPFNVQSTVQLRDILFNKLKLSTKGVKRGKTGLSVDAEVLGRLAGEHPLAAKVVEHRALAKLSSTYVTGLLPLIDPSSGRLRTSFNQTVAATGRLSSSEPNLQNIPIRSAEGRRIRGAFVAAPGNVLVSADYSQIELRVLAHLTEDPVLLGAFRDGEDIHRRTAAEVFGVAPDQVSSEQRRQAKVINFGIIYGMGAQRLSRELGILLADAEAYIRRYFERYGRVREFAQRVLEGGRTDGYVATMIGRRRYLPDLNARAPHLRQAAERMAWNSPIQGSAADIIKMAMVAVERELGSPHAPGRMLLQVHDELLFEVQTGALDEVVGVVRRLMESVVELAVPLVVDVEHGATWADLH